MSNGILLSMKEMSILFVDERIHDLQVNWITFRITRKRKEGQRILVARINNRVRCSIPFDTKGVASGAIEWHDAVVEGLLVKVIIRSEMLTEEKYRQVRPVDPPTMKKEVLDGLLVRFHVADADGGTFIVTATMDAEDVVHIVEHVTGRRIDHTSVLYHAREGDRRSVFHEFADRCYQANDIHHAVDVVEILFHRDSGHAVTEGGVWRHAKDWTKQELGPVEHLPIILNGPGIIACH